MSRFLTLTLVLGAVLIGLTLTPAAIAQENATDEGPTVEVGTNVELGNETAIEAIDSTTDLVSWTYDDDRNGFELRFRSERSQRIAITEAVQFEEGTGSGRTYENRLPSGASEIFVPVDRRGGEAAITMITEESREDNRYSWVSTGQAEPDRPPLDYERVRLMILLTAFGTAAFVFRTVRNRRDDEQKEAERIL